MPVTTGEIWNVWIEHPELASAVDFIAAHVLPYWEGISEAAAVDQAIRIYDMLRQAYPGKRIVIAEFGWPSAGYNRRDANPDPLMQAQVLRNFVARAEALGIDYNIIEAYDQPWKTFEGGVGPYWGMFDTVAAAEILLDRADHRSRSLEARRHRGADRRAAVAADPVARRRDRRPDRAARGRRPRRRRLVRDPVRLLERALLRDGRGVRLRRSRCVLLIPLIFIALERIEEIANVAFGTQAAPADRVAAARAGAAVRAEGFDPHPGLPRAAGDAQADARCGGAARISELRVHRRHQQHARSGAVAADRGALQDARRALQVRARGQPRRASRPARCGWR